MISLIYLDYAATTPVDERVAQEMQRYLTREGLFANPASILYADGIRALEVVENARAQVADLIHAQADEIVWTSGATEAMNLALKGMMEFYRRKGRHLVTVKTEHRAGLKVCEYLEQQGVEVTYLTPLSSGLIDLNELEHAVRADTVLVSIMHVNNEIGVIQDIAAIAALVKSKHSFLHVDAAQSAGKLPIDLRSLPVDLMSFSAHKLYGPKGVGALFVREAPRVRLTPLIHGGGGERGLRSGTLPVHQIAGMGLAFQLARTESTTFLSHYKMLRSLFLKGIKTLSGIHIHGDLTQCLPNIVSISVEAVDSEQLVEMLTRKLAISTGSACATANLEPSYVLRALGVPVPLAQATIRFSFGKWTTEANIQWASEYFVECVTLLRRK